MPRYKITLAYHGREYFGFQVQPQKKTIQGALEDTFFKILGETLRVTPSGRTDTGVHAKKQTCHLDILSQKAIQRADAADMVYKLNAVLPNDCRVISFKKTKDTFHAQRQCRQKKYTYNILVSRFKNPFLNDFVWCLHTPLDQQAMKKAAVALTGTHDFSAFCASDSAAKNKTRKILKITFSNRKPSAFLAIKGETYISITFTGTGFLKQMVRNMVGTLVAVGQHKIKPLDIKKILHSKDRKKAFATAPAKGLFLTEVNY
ncbi:MAG: tRNA pseudouridine(38-40) synthase TruA [Deltaproteobacteria bacterium]|nr:tRNA pseudouridine(38-40) synthase TruA [Deltaproteobacteria bacterium]